MTFGQSASSKDASLNDEIGLLDILRVLKGRKTLILIVAVVAGFSVFAFTLLLDDLYRAEAVLIPANESQSPQLGAQLGLAANLAGVNLSRSDDKTVKALATLQSRDFLGKFIREHELLPWLFASEYNNAQKASVIDPNIYDVEALVWRGGPDSMPTEGKALEEFQRALTVREDQGSGLVTIAVEWIDPYLAAQWVNWLVADVNDHLRTSDMLEAEKAIEYLQNQLSNTPLIEMQRVFYQLIESQTRTLMLGDIREGYIFEVIDPATAPEKKSNPQRLLSSLLGVFIGGIVAIFFVLIRHFSIAE